MKAGLAPDAAPRLGRPDETRGPECGSGGRRALRRLIELSRTLSEEERRVVVEDMTEEQLAIFDLLTKPEPDLNDADRATVKASAKRLLTHLHDKLVLDWRRKAETVADVRITIRDMLDQDLPADPYPPALFETKVQAVFDHFLTAYGDDGISAYTAPEEIVTPASTAPVTIVPDLAAMADEIIEQIRADAELASRVAEQLGVRPTSAPWTNCRRSSRFRDGVRQSVERSSTSGHAPIRRPQCRVVEQRFGLRRHSAEAAARERTPDVGDIKSLNIDLVLESREGLDPILEDFEDEVVLM